MGYKHLTREQRYTIEALLQTTMSLREIGEVIGVSTLCHKAYMFNMTGPSYRVKETQNIFKKL